MKKKKRMVERGIRYNIPTDYVVLLYQDEKRPNAEKTGSGPSYIPK